MSVNVICELPADVRVSDASEVIGILAGLPIVEKHHLRSNGPLGIPTLVVEPTEDTDTYLTVPGVKVVGNHAIPEMADITLNGDLVDGEKEHLCYWHFESDNGTSRSIRPKSTAFWISICKGLVDFFGGELIYADCSSSSCDYKRDALYSNNTEDDTVYEEMETRKRNIKPLTLEDLKEVHSLAGYDTPEIFEGD